ncbi:hypothetical protein [Actinoplanes solisilvae]|uniref:hypothetical protein n=1 Tax=Actinoplanes solisilvae TaxID=2486853 RepID=UPI000FDB16A9|nr:hypothetical protein [Actinoplanes solisilvae]
MRVGLLLSRVPDDNGYAHPIEGVVAVVDLTAREVVAVHGARRTADGGRALSLIARVAPAPQVARLSAGVAAACLVAHVALLGVAGAAAAPMLALSLVCAVCARGGWRGRCSRGEQVTMVVLSALMLLTHQWIGHAHGPYATVLTQFTTGLAATQLGLGVLALLRGR